jgi:hypothetical protein
MQLSAPCRKQQDTSAGKLAARQYVLEASKMICPPKTVALRSKLLPWPWLDNRQQDDSMTPHSSDAITHVMLYDKPTNHTLRLWLTLQQLDR